MFALTSH